MNRTNQKPFRLTEWLFFNFMIKVPKFIPFLFKSQIWQFPNPDRHIYLTFDDGPIPEVTDSILSILEEKQVEATFFCIGDNIKKYPDLFKKIIAKKHAIGNHTFNHLKGWNTSNETYIQNVLLCQAEIEKHHFSVALFRPPYGKIKPKQSKLLREKGFKIIMWDVLSRDYNPNTDSTTCYNNTIRHTESGSIIVFHDSLKAKNNVLESLPKVIDTLKEKGYTFKKID